MLEDLTVVQSAVSAFNNAALWAPAFLWWALLMLPLFAFVVKCGGVFVKHIGWNRENLINKVAFWTAIFVFLWMVLFAGNYGVLRDSLSVLPMLNATILFLSSLFVSSHFATEKIPHIKLRGVLFAVLLVVMVGMSGIYTWWGPLLQIGAFVAGVLFGRVAKSPMRPIGGSILIMLTTVSAILMQPEFFRFGQLGNLTVFHLSAILLFGVFSVATVVVYNINPGNKINHSIYIKLKWLCRVFCMLGSALFLLTEAVPVFLGTLVVFGLMFMLSVFHVEHITDNLQEKLFALSLMCFGVITVMPVITAMGLLLWIDNPKNKFWSEFKMLL